MMRTVAGSIVYDFDASASAIKYQLGAIASTIIPRHGNFEDWAFAANWSLSNGLSL